jgi:hypothetical protein
MTRGVFPDAMGPPCLSVCGWGHRCESWPICRAPFEGAGAKAIGKARCETTSKKMAVRERFYCSLVIGVSIVVFQVGNTLIEIEDSGVSEF